MIQTRIIYRVRHLGKLVKFHTQKNTVHWTYIQISHNGKWINYPSEYSSLSKAKEMASKAGLHDASIVIHEQVYKPSK